MQPVLLHFTPTEYDALKARADNAVDPTELAQSLTSKVSVGTPIVLPPGSAAAGSAPLRLTSQTTPLAVVEEGAFELIGNSLQFSQHVKRRGVVMSQDTRTSTTTIVNSTAETLLDQDDHGADYLEVGKVEDIRLYGQIAQTSVGSGSLFVRVKYAGVTVLTLSTAVGTITVRPFNIFVITTLPSYTRAL